MGESENVVYYSDMHAPGNREFLYPSLSDSLHVRLFTVALLPIDQGWNTRQVQSSYWRLYRNDAEGAALLRDAGPYPLRAGRLYFVPAGVRFDCHCEGSVGHFYIHFDLIGLPGFALRTLFGGPVCVPSDAALDTLAEPLVGTREAAPPGLTRQCAAKALVYGGLAAYLASVPPADVDRCGRLAEAHAPVLPAVEFIERNLGAELSNRQLADLCALSEDYFIRRFRECVGQSPAQFIQERRVTVAAQQLLFTDHSIERIAEATGFRNRFYFSRVFTRQTGVPPAAYRKTTRV